MLLRHSLKLEQEAAAIEKAVDNVLKTGARTADIAAGGSSIGFRRHGRSGREGISLIFRTSG